MEEENHDSGLGLRELILVERERAIQEIDTLALQWIDFTDIKGKLRVAIQNNSNVIRIHASNLQDKPTSAPFSYDRLGESGGPLSEDRGMKALLRMVEMLDSEGMKTTISLEGLILDEEGREIESYRQLSLVDPRSELDGMYYASLCEVTIHF